jgi:hypothetical protein
LQSSFCYSGLIFKDHLGGLLGGLVQLIENAFAVIVELYVVMLAIARTIDFFCTHVYRVGNVVFDVMANNGQSLQTLASQWWLHPRAFILPLLSRDSLELTFYGVSRL